jgi:hypothetical protein
MPRRGGSASCLLDAAQLGNMSYRQRVLAIYQTYAQDKVASVDKTLEKYAGAEDQLIAALVQKYGPEPVAGAAPADTTPASPSSASLAPSPSMSAAAPSATAPSAAAPSAGDYRARVLAMYQAYAQDKVASVDKTLEKYAGAEDQLIAALVQKYGPEPVAGAAPADTTPASPLSASLAPSPSMSAAAPSATAPSAAAPSAGDYRARVLAMYQAYAQDKVASVDKTLEKYAGAEDQLIAALVQKYGPEPVAGAAPADTTPASPSSASLAPSPSMSAAAPSATAPSAAAPSAGDYRARVLAMYQAYAQDKVASVDKTLEKYAGAEDQLIAALVQKYGPEPVAGAAPADTTPASPSSASLAPSPSMSAAAPSATAPSAAAPSAGDYRARVLAMYQAYAQDKVASVDKTLEKYAGAEDQLIAALVQKYGPEPVAGAAPADTTPASPSSASLAPSPSMSAAAPSATAPSAAAPSAGDYRARVLAMYQAYAQDKVASVDKTLEKYAGAEDQLIAALVQKYGPEPVAGAAPADTTPASPSSASLAPSPSMSAAVPSATAPSAAAPSAGDYRARVLAMYQAYAQDKVASVDKTLEKYAGAEDQLIAALVQKYGPEPVAGAAPADTTPASPSSASLAPSPSMSAAAPSATAPSAAAPSAGDYRARVLAMYQAYAQDKVASVDKTLEKYAGAEDQLIAALVQKYGPEPVAGAAPADTTPASPSSASLAPSPSMSAAAPSATAPSAAAPSAGDYRARVLAMYQAYAQDKVASVDKTLEKYAGAEDQLIAALVQKYGPEPVAGAAPADTTPASPSSASLAPSPSMSAAVPSATAPSAAAPSAGDYRARVLAMYQAYAQDKVASVDKTLEKYAGAEDQLIAALVQKYGPEPVAGAAPADTTPASPSSASLAPSPSMSAAAPSATAPSAAAPSAGDYRARVLAMYQAYAQDKVASVDKTLEKYAGAEDQLIAALVQKYGPEPVAGAAPADTTPASPSSASLAPSPSMSAAAPSATAPSAAAPSAGDYRARVLAMYQAYAQDKVASVDKTLEKYAGAEDQLIAALVQKYGPEPKVGQSTRAVEPMRAPQTLSSRAEVIADKPSATGDRAAVLRREVESRSSAVVAHLSELEVHAYDTATSAFKDQSFNVMWESYVTETVSALEHMQREDLQRQATALDVRAPRYPFTAGIAGETFEKFFSVLGLQSQNPPSVDSECVVLLASALGLAADEFGAVTTADEFRRSLTRICDSESRIVGEMNAFIKQLNEKTSSPVDVTGTLDVACWAYKCIFPVVQETWLRVWIVIRRGKLLWFHESKDKPQGSVPLSQISDARLTSMLNTKAPRHLAKNGLRMKLNTKPHPIFLALCPETMTAAHEIVQIIRSSCTTSSPARKRIAEPEGLRIYTLRAGQSKWRAAWWSVVENSVCLVDSETGQHSSFAIQQIRGVRPRPTSMPVKPPVKSGAHLCAFVVSLHNADLYFCAEKPDQCDAIVNTLQKHLLRSRLFGHSSPVRE